MTEAPQENPYSVIKKDPWRGGKETQLTEAQTQANTPEFQRKNPITSAYQKYQNPSQMDNKGTAFSYGKAFRNLVDSPTNPISNVLDSGVYPSAFGGALLGGGLLAGGSLIKNMLSDDQHQTPTLRNALLGLLAGGGLGAALAYSRAQQPKQASSWRGSGFYNDPNRRNSANARQEVAAAIAQAPGISMAARREYAASLARMSQSEISMLAQAIRTAGFAGIGAVLARFLLGKGFARMALGGIVGGLLGNLTTPSRNGRMGF